MPDHSIAEAVNRTVVAPGRDLVDQLQVSGAAIKAIYTRPNGGDATRAPTLGHSRVSIFVFTVTTMGCEALSAQVEAPAERARGSI